MFEQSLRRSLTLSCNMQQNKIKFDYISASTDLVMVMRAVFMKK
jgi:hypothetical protein